MALQVLVTLLLLGAALSQNCGLSPADPKASELTKKVLCYLKTHSYISGQTDLGDADKVLQMTGRYPAIVAFDFYRYTDGDTSDTAKAIQFARDKKGIIAFQWHWKCPYGGEFYQYPCDFSKDLYNSNSKLHQDMRTVLTEMKKIGDAGHVVLFRPLHEANNNYMWWARHGSGNYKALWKVMFDMAQNLGVHNLIWVFNGMASGQGTQMKEWYPGDGMADVVSSDYFQSWDDYKILQAIGNNKVVALSETFNQLDPSKDPPFSHSVVWASRDWGGKGAENSWKVAMANSKTIAINNLDNFNGGGNSNPPPSTPTNPPSGGNGNGNGNGCDDVQPPGNSYSCAEQASWGKCNEAWMNGYCKSSCKTCSQPAPPPGGNTCTDIAPSGQYSCAQQVSWGKCNEDWMKGFCMASCGKCSSRAVAGEGTPFRVNADGTTTVLVSEGGYLGWQVAIIAILSVIGVLLLVVIGLVVSVTGKPAKRV